MATAPKSKPKLTAKEAKFVQAKAEGKTNREAYLEAYDTNGHLATVDAEASRTANKPHVQAALQSLFLPEKTREVVNNLHRLATSANDDRNQIEATKVWLERAVPKSEGVQGNTFINVQGDLKAKYSDV